MEDITLLYTILAAIYLILIVSTMIVVLTDNSSPARTIAWLMVLIFVPVGGLVFYYMFGQDKRKQKFVTKNYYQKIKGMTFNELVPDENSDLVPTYINLINLLKNNNHAALLQGSKVEIISSGERMFEALIADLDAAKDHIHIEFFIFKNDETGNLVRTVLMKKALQGVKVRFLYDNVANWMVPRTFYSEMKDTGVEVGSLMETRYPLLQSSKLNYRNHRKVVVIDGNIGYVGGMNVGNDYSINRHWMDRHLRIEGMGAHGLQSDFLLDWFAAGKQCPNLKKYFPPTKLYTDNLMQIATSGPYSKFTNLLQATISIILSAKKYVYMQTPYFLPTDSLFEALQIAALSGVDVRLMVSKKSDSAYIDPAARSYYEDLLRAGMRIYELQGSFVHAKTLVADDNLSVIGSCNLDFRSLETNFEINCYLYDTDLAQQNKAIFCEQSKLCKEICYEEWVKRGKLKRLLESFVRLFAQLM
ncbi:MAG: cardiolipin synthase [Candidatus Symbiothrix sp.]|jgi:cardiolipin synthase|nr:cardiolipin synthase [Candidatus Symbiothrix sp.]